MLSCDSPRACRSERISARTVPIFPIHHIQSCKRAVYLLMNVQLGHSLRTNEHTKGFPIRTHSSPSVPFASEPTPHLRGLHIRTESVHSPEPTSPPRVIHIFRTHDTLSALAHPISSLRSRTLSAIWNNRCSFGTSSPVGIDASKRITCDAVWVGEGQLPISVARVRLMRVSSLMRSCVSALVWVGLYPVWGSI